jgi:hypothetical protein
MNNRRNGPPCKGEFDLWHSVARPLAVPQCLEITLGNQITDLGHESLHRYHPLSITVLPTANKGLHADHHRPARLATGANTFIISEFQLRSMVYWKLTGIYV